MRKLLAAICLLGAAAHSADPDLREMFERARMLANQNQNLSEAIRLFGQVVSLARSERALAAQAQFQQGLLYERLGRKVDAQRAFRAVVSGFPDQKGVVALARAKLPPAPLEVGNRRVWAGDDVDTTGAISPDGRLLSFTDWKTGDLVVHDLETGENRYLTRNGGLLHEAAQFAASSAFSRDGQWLAYSWQPPGDLTPMEVRLIGRDGTGQRTVFRDASWNWLTVNDWTPDRKYLLVAAQHAASATLLLVTIADGSSREIPVSARWYAGRALLSPDGQYAAYDAHQADGTPEVRVAGIAGGDAPLMADSGDDSVLGWSPDGSKLVFRSYRSGEYDIWGVRVVNGEARGSPERLKSNAEQFSYSFGITRQGSLFYAIDGGASDVFLTELDSESGKLAPAKLLSQRFVGTKTSPAWSPDGSTAVYAAKDMLRLHAMPTAVERDVRPEMFQVRRVLEWHPDGRSVFAQGFDSHNNGGTFRVDLETGDARMVLPGIVDREAFSRDANTVYTWGGGKQPNAIVSHDLRTGEERVLHSRPVASEIQNPNLSLSPDGTMLALQLRNVPPGYDSLAVMPATGGEPRTILQIRRPEWFGANSFAWSPDMRYIFAARNLTNHSEIWRVPVNGGPAQPTGLSMAGDIRQLHLNPNGRQFVFTNARGAGEVWVLENFLPPVPPARPARR